MNFISNFKCCNSQVLLRPSFLYVTRCLDRRPLWPFLSLSLTPPASTHSFLLPLRVSPNRYLSRHTKRTSRRSIYGASHDLGFLLVTPVEDRGSVQKGLFCCWRPQGTPKSRKRFREICGPPYKCTKSSLCVRSPGSSLTDLFLGRFGWPRIVSRAELLIRVGLTHKRGNDCIHYVTCRFVPLSGFVINSIFPSSFRVLGEES